MNADFINAFVSAGTNTLTVLLGQEPTIGKVFAQPAAFPIEQCNVTIGVTGQLQGTVIYGVSLGAADRIASTMLGTKIVTFNSMAESAIAELCNMVNGNALLNLSEKGFVCDMTPPTLIRGYSKVMMSTLSIPAIVVPLVTKLGDLLITVSLEAKAGGGA